MAKKFHNEILSDEQLRLLPLLKSARKSGFYLVGWTAIALHLWHRESIDFDLFHPNGFDQTKIRLVMNRGKANFSSLMVSREGESTGIVDGVKVTFFHYPFPIDAVDDFEGCVKMPRLLTLAAMKAYAMGRRSKWKDYVDLYFLIKYHFSIPEISREAESVFGGAFNEKLFREQLHYFEGIDHREEVNYLIPHPPSDDEVREFLREASVS